MVLTPRPDHPTLGELFGAELMNAQLSARLFSFLYTNRYSSLKFQHDDLKISRSDEPPQDKEHNVMDELMRREIVDTAVIGCPNIEYYPVSLERFIQEIFDREFNA